MAARYVYDVARNHLRILNHIDIIDQKIEIGRRLGLLNESRPSSITKEEFRELAELSMTDLSPCERGTVERLALLEVHPTDVCDLACVKCYYPRSPNTIPLNVLVRILRRTSPRGVVLVGGGEPTLYRDRSNGAGLTELVCAVRNAVPGVRIGLITNGVTIPTGNWTKHVDWLRVSLDAATAETYSLLKGRDAFHVVVRHIADYLNSEVPHVGVGFLCNRWNIKEVTQLFELLKGLIASSPPQNRDKLNVQFRPFRQRPDAAEQSGTKRSDANLCCSEAELRQSGLALSEMRRNPELAQFMDQVSNWERVERVVDGNREFDRCYRALTFRLLRPDGDLLPCFAHVGDPEYSAANACSDDLDYAVTVSALMGFYYFDRRGRFCQPAMCPLYRENVVCTEHRAGHREVLSESAKRSPFF